MNDRIREVQRATGKTVVPLVAFEVRMALGRTQLRCPALQALTQHFLRVCGPYEAPLRKH